jgi:hypothetical protein
MIMAKRSVTLSSLVGVSCWAMKKALLFTSLAALFAAIAFGSVQAGTPPPTCRLDVLSAKSTEHPWLRSQTFAQDMAAFSPALNKVLTSIQAKVSEQKITSTRCMGRLGGGIGTEDGGFLVYEMVREDQHWELKVTQFDKAAADAFRERVKSGKTDIDAQKEYFAHPDARLVIEGANWTIYQGEQVRSGTIAEK